MRVPNILEASDHLRRDGLERAFAVSAERPPSFSLN